MDELNAFYNSSGNQRIFLEGAASGGRYSRPTGLVQEESPRDAAFEPLPGISYVTEYLDKERNNAKSSHLNISAEHELDLLDEDNTDIMEDTLFQEQTAILYQTYNLNKVSEESFPIDTLKSQILGSIRSQSVTIIEGPTGCGKTTQVPQWILQDSYKNRTHCNILVTQPRRIAAISIAKRVCEENNLVLGELIGYQIGLNKKISNDTRLQYVTTGVFLQHLVSRKNMKTYTHIILDEVHEREKDMDFLLLIVRKLLWINSQNVKIILMSATFNVRKFSQYFSTQTGNGYERIPIISLSEKRSHKLGIYYLDELSLIGQLPEVNMEEPLISQNHYEFAVKLLNAFEKMEIACCDSSRRGVLIFLPGICEIEELYMMLNNETIRLKIDPNSKLHKWWVIPLHSTITTEEQVKAFKRPPNDFRKIILATNIAESSITVPDIKYVIDFCLTKMLICNRNTNFSSLQLCWASQNSCVQRAGRAGRVCDGKVYRLVPSGFYNQLPVECPPEMLRCSLETLVLSTKLLKMGSPKAILALAMDPPDLTNIFKTVLALKEIGAISKTLENKICYDDGDITNLGKIMAKLPLDVRVSKLIMLGYIFGCLDDCIIMGAAVTSKNVFSSPFLERMNAFNSKLTWAFGSTSDCIAFLNVYKVYESFKKQNNFSQYKGGARAWAKSTFVQLNAMEELSKLVEEIKHRLCAEGITENTFEQRTLWTSVERPLILKMVIAGAFYPHYFILSSGSESDEHQAVKTLNGGNPFNTVYLSNMDGTQPGALYSHQVKKLFSNLNLDDVNVTFDSNSSKIFVSCPDISQPKSIQKTKIPGKVSLFVYQALKMRQLKIPLILNVMPSNKAMQKALELGINVDRKLEKYQLSESCRKSLSQSLTSRLPGIDETYISINVTYIQDCGNFWAQHDFESSKRDLEWICNTLNSTSNVTRSFNSKPIVGKLYAAPFRHNEVSPQLYYRARVERNLPNNSTWVHFIDFGQNEEISNGLLRELNPKVTGLFEMKPVAFKCTLAEIGPSFFKDTMGYWTKEANQRFFGLTNCSPLYGKVYSVVNSVVALELYAGNTNINEVLLNDGFAQVIEESYASKVNKDLRERILDFGPSQISFFNEQQLQQDNESCDYLPLSPEECTNKIYLKGPYSPLETNVYSIMYTGKQKRVTVEWDSVNSILLNTEPQNNKERLLVAASIFDSTDGGVFKIRNTTLMPNISGLVELVSLIFCPTAELCCNPQRDRYVAILCGLGHVNGKPLFPEHDMVVNINFEITNEDIKNINFLRYTMDFELLNFETHLMSEEQRNGTTKTIKKIIEKLISRHRKQHEYVATTDLWRWNKEDSKDIFHGPDLFNTSGIYPPHNAIRLLPKNPSTLLKLAQENAKIHDICKGIQKSSLKEFQCNLCDTGLLNIPSLRLHLYSRMHRDHEKDLPPLPSK